MYKRYFKKKNPHCRIEDIEWVEMTGGEFYKFITAPENQNRHFIDMDDVVLESSKAEARKYRAEKDHSDYIKKHEEGWSTLSLYAIEEEDCCNGEEVIGDEAQDVEAAVIVNMEIESLNAALSLLDDKSYLLIFDLYLADDRKTERELAKEHGVSKNAIHKQKKKILNILNFLVGKTQKSSQ